MQTEDQNQIIEMAAEIVSVVSAEDGPVLLSRIEKEVEGFAARDNEALSWGYKPLTPGPLLWSGMGREGVDALILAWRSGLVAMAPVEPEMYLPEGRHPPEPDWLPVALAPAYLANIEGRGRLFYFPSGSIEKLMEMMGRPGDSPNWRRLVRH
jgi:hypothetical protein